MSGGIAYVYDPTGIFPERCNMGLVSLHDVSDYEEKQELKSFIKEHYNNTGSVKAKEILDNFDGECDKFVKVYPVDYARVLDALKQANEDQAAA